MRTIRIILLCTNLLLLATGMRAQQQPLFSQYMMNEFLINPAAAGYDGYTSINLTAREQWRGIENAPSTHSLSWQTRILKRNYVIRTKSPNRKRFVSARSGRVGLGASVYNDHNGMIDRTGLQFTYAYHVFIRNTQLSFGLTGSAYQFRFSENFNPDEPDPFLQGVKKSVFVPDASFGTFLLNKYYYAGFSVDQLMQSMIKIDNTKSLQNYHLHRIYYLTGGYRYVMANRNYEFEPSFLFKTSEIMRPQADISAKLYYKDDYWLGVSYRTDYSIILMGGVHFKKLWAGYAFDYNFVNLTRYTYGTHELMLALKFGDSARRYRWLIRY